MTMWNNKAFTENELSIFSKIFITLLVIGALFSTFMNILQGQVKNPVSFIVTILGFILFLVSKVSQFRKGKLLSFGTKNMSESMANCYRVGYWLMIVGLVMTFF